MTITANCVTVTPELAAKWLATSKGNRHVSRHAVARLAADMRNGLWRHNGDRIRFLSDGTLYDGHHRMTACVESGVSIITDVFVMQEDAKQTVDKGKSRTTADNLALDGLVDASISNTVATALRMLIMHDKTDVTEWAANPSIAHADIMSEQSITAYFYTVRDEVLSAARWAHEVIKKQDTLIPKSSAVVFIVLASREYGEEQAKEYLSAVLTGFGILPETTAAHIRARLLAVKMRQSKMANNHRLYMVCKGFKSIMAGRTIKHATNAHFRPSSDIVPRFTVPK